MRVKSSKKALSRNRTVLWNGQYRERGKEIKMQGADLYHMRKASILLTEAWAFCG